MPSRRRAVLFVFIGALLIQCAWIMVMPAFRGIDEFDHAYRADSVANGYWSAGNELPQHGRGGLIPARRSLVEAAHPICSFYAYTGKDNCNPVEPAGDGLVMVASGAATYNPVFYWIIGTAALPFKRVAALYVMRAVTALISSIFIALAAWGLLVRSRTSWPLIALLVSLTPVALYSTSIASPNGVEICAALSVWAALIAGSSKRGAVGAEKRLSLMMLPGIVTLATIRQLGPFWLAAIGAVGLAVWGRNCLSNVPRVQRLGVVAVAVLSSLLGALWTASAGSLTVAHKGHLPSPVTGTLRQVPAWLFQSVAAFPTRNEQAPIFVYAACLFCGLLLVVGGVAVASRRIRWQILGVIAASIAVPFVITVATYATAGPVWQGRYTLPLSLGALLLCGVALDERDFTHRLVRPVLLASWLALLAAHGTSIGAVYQQELHRPSAVATDAWPLVPVWVPMAAVALAGICWLKAYKSNAIVEPEHTTRLEAALAGQV